MKTIDTTYTGQYARAYDSKRSDSIGWKREAQAIEPILRLISRGDTVLDIAAGTGRWLQTYSEIGAQPILLDASREMLAQAQLKAERLGLPLSAVVQSALGDTPFPMAQWAVITRFFNWIPLGKVEKVLTKALAAGVGDLLFMLTYLPTSTGQVRRLETRYVTFRRNAASLLGRREKSLYYLHSEGAVRMMLASLGLQIRIERVISDTPERRTVMFHASRSRSEGSPPITILDACHFDEGQCVVNGQKCASMRGSWAFYIPSRELKLLHAVQNHVHCIHRTAPDREALFSEDAELTLSTLYTKEDWVGALSKSVVRRAVENYVAASRLYQAGLGPEPLGLCLVRKFTANYCDTQCQTAGMFVRDARRYRRKREATVDEICAAGVSPDRLMSCVREQINGYVSDLNSVVGVVPTRGDALVASIERDVNHALQRLC